MGSQEVLASLKIAGCMGSIAFAGCTSDATEGSGQEPTETMTPTATGPESTLTETETATETESFNGWVNESELEDGYTVVHISAEWEVVPADQTNDWNSAEVSISRRGLCKRYFVYEEIPDGYNVFYQVRCDDGVKVTVKDADGRIVAQIELPKKEVSRE
jgi:hypothetical protein